jgi:hypothetical protein
MFRIKRNMQLFAAFAALLLAASFIGCNGFFVDPTLTTVTVTPKTPSVVEGNTLQLTATGSYDDGSTKNITGSATWTTSDSSIATVNSSGLMTGVATGNATITATSGIISGETSATVQVANLQSIVISPSNTSIRSGETKQYTATGHLQDGSTPDITNSVTWNSSNTDAVTMDATGLATAKTVTATTQVTISATSGTVIGSTTLTVSP